MLGSYPPERIDGTEAGHLVGQGRFEVAEHSKKAEGPIGSGLNIPAASRKCTCACYLPFPCPAEPLPHLLCPSHRHPRTAPPSQPLVQPDMPVPAHHFSAGTGTRSPGTRSTHTRSPGTCSTRQQRGSEIKVQEPQGRSPKTTEDGS